MHSNDEFHLSPAELVRTLVTHVKWWAIPAISCAILAAGYSLVAPRHWQATQALTVRPEAASVSLQQLGKFSDLSEIKVLQATILALAKSQSVIESTLQSVGPAKASEAHNWPTARQNAKFREQIDMRPPGGAEFGQTEVFYLSVRDTNRDRAAALVAELCNQLERRMQCLRDDRAQSMMAELEKTVSMAEADLAERTVELSNFEALIGSDLAELRNLNATSGSQSEVALEMQSIEGERRSNAVRRQENEQLLKLLQVAQADPRQLIATPGSLLVSQPAISRLKDALIDAQIRTANLLGTYAEDHPFILAARESEALVQNQLHDEVGAAIQALEVDLQSNNSREVLLNAGLVAGRDRLARLAGARAKYANLISAVENHTALVETARLNLADARADHASAHSASVIGRIDGVDTGIRPVGPGRTTITAAGGMAGLILGFGLVFLFAGSTPSEPSRVIELDAPPPQSKTVPSERFGLFRRMTLDELIRQAEMSRSAADK